MKKNSFNNGFFQDSPHLQGEDMFWSNDVPRVNDRFTGKPVSIEDNYLYTDENVDRYNAGKDYSQRIGQPKGVDKTNGVSVNQFKSPEQSDQITKVFVGDLITSFNNEEKIISDITKDTGGQ